MVMISDSHGMTSSVQMNPSYSEGSRFDPGRDYFCLHSKFSVNLHLAFVPVPLDCLPGPYFRRISIMQQLFNTIGIFQFLSLTCIRFALQGGVVVKEI